MSSGKSLAQDSLEFKLNKVLFTQIDDETNDGSAMSLNSPSQYSSVLSGLDSSIAESNAGSSTHSSATKKTWESYTLDKKLAIIAKAEQRIADRHIGGDLLRCCKIQISVTSLDGKWNKIDENKYGDTSDEITIDLISFEDIFDRAVVREI